jgi:hypothetical protein
MRRYDVAAHEAAHIVVGVATGLRVRRAVLGDEPNHGDWRTYGAVWFYDRHAPVLSLSLAYAAGCAWDRMLGEESAGDFELLRKMRYTRREIDALVLASSAILSARMPVHRRVTAALYERDLTGRDISRIVSGERLT